MFNLNFIHMKNFIYKRGILMFCLTLLFSFNSCSNDGTSNDELGNSNTTNVTARQSAEEIVQTYNSIIEINDTGEQRLVASALSSEDKFSLWQYKLDNFKNNNNLSVAQINFINDLKRDLTELVFVENSDARKEFILNKKNEYMTNAKLLFGENEGRYLLTKVENINHRIEKITADNNRVVSGGPIRKCDCESNSECWRLTGVSVWGLSWEYGNCSNNTCTVEVYLFGLWESSNIGRCTY